MDGREPRRSRPAGERCLAPAELAGHPALAAGDVLDVRPADVFRTGHLPGAFSWPLPAAGGAVPAAAALAAWLPGHRLPPRHLPLLVVAVTPAQAAAVAAFLRRGGRRADGVAWPAVAAAGLPLESGPGRPALCRPQPWLVARRHLLPPPAAGPVLDCGCGSGRHAVWLARRGYRVTAADRDPGALARAADLAAAYGVTVRTVRADLAHPAQVPPGPWSVLLAIRYLERSLLACAAALVRPGGVVALRTFRWEEGMADRLPRRRFCLAPGEAAALLPSPPFTVLDAVEDDDPDGRPAVGIVWRREPSGHSST